MKTATERSFQEKSDVALPRLPDGVAERLIESHVKIASLVPLLAEPFNNPKLLTALARLVLEIGPDLDQFDTIISDETSGRPVALLLWSLANRRREQRRQKDIPGYFIIPHFELSAQTDLHKFLSRRSMGDMVLLATEAICGGHHIRRLIGRVSKLDVDYGIATVSLNGQPREYELEITKRLYYGIIRFDNGDFIYTRWREQGGVMRTGLVHPHKDQFFFSAGKVARARKDIALIADAFYGLTFLKPPVSF